MSGVDDDKYIDIDSGERVQIVSQQIYQVILLKENVSRVDGGDLEKISICNRNILLYYGCDDRVLNFALGRS